MRLLVDMNLSPTWVGFFASNGVESIHWSQVGHPAAADVVLMDWARREGFVVFTHDLDFSILIALTGATGPSVIQVRTQAVLPEDIGPTVMAVLGQAVDALAMGAIVSIDEHASRVRVLPIARGLASDRSA